MALSDLREGVRRLIQRPGTADLQRLWPVVVAAGQREADLQARSSAELTATAGRLRDTPAPFGRVEWAAVCAVGREAARRTLDERPFDVQLLGTVGLLSGHVVEMATGEGKTLTGALAAAGFALQGRRVHVVSVNDYLAERDARWMRELYEALGVSVGWLDQRSSWQQRRDGYARDVTYVSVSEVGFDVLRDRLRTDAADLVLPDPDVVIVDEADSVLIDEATVPLVLAGADRRELGHREAARVVRELVAGTHYEVDGDERGVYLTDAGIDHVQERLDGVDLYTVEHVELLTEVNLALQARALLRRDVDYLVRNGQVELINTARGRVARRQRWPDGLQAAVEAKEELTISPTGRVLDSIVVQELIGRYRTVCGMSGTAVTVAEQLAEFYGLRTGRVPTNRPGIRADEPDRLYADLAGKEAALVDYVRAVHRTGQPVLLGTLSVAESERLADTLAAAGVPGVVLNAKNDADEAAIIARAGEYGRVTISTQMAGRGTDIRLGGASDDRGHNHDHERIVELGGLCVVASSRYHSRRLDDQLRGRAGRQGDPGRSVVFTSLTDDVVTRNAPVATKPGSVDADGRVRDAKARHAVEHAQRVAEGVHLSLHRTTWKYHQLVGRHRHIVLDHRDEVLRGDRAARRLRELRPERCEALDATVGADVLRRAARAIALYHLDECWSDYLAFLTDLREGIHLHALARQAPIDEFHRAAIAEFARFFPTADDRAADTFGRADITADGVDLDALDLKRPSSTWTYLITDDPYGSPGTRLLEALSGAIRGRAGKLVRS